MKKAKKVWHYCATAMYSLDFLSIVQDIGSLHLLFSLSWTDSIPTVDDVYNIANTFDAFNSSTKGPLNTFQCVVLRILYMFYEEIFKIERHRMLLDR